MAAAQDVSPELIANLGFHNAADLEALRGFIGRPLGIMPRRGTRGSLGRSPDMEKAGLEAVPTVNNGNCFFAAISDQLYGNDSHTAEFRALAVKHILDNKDKFILFTDVKAGGGTRHTAKRKNAGGYSVSVDHGPASEEAIELSFKNRMAEMARDRTYVEQQEIWALATVLKINIRIYEPASTMHTDEAPGCTKPVAAIAYDPIGQHYSSVRRIGDPRTGPALIQGCYESPVVESIEDSIPPQSPAKSILSHTELLHPEQWARSRSSTPGSGSIQRDTEDDIAPTKPLKRSASGRKIRNATSRKPSSLSKKVNAVSTPSTIASREPSPEAVIVVGEAEATTESNEEKTTKEEKTNKVGKENTLEEPPLSASTLPSPPYTQSRSPSVVVISTDDEEEGDESPLSPKKIAQRRRSSKRAEREKAALLSVESATEAAKSAVKKSRRKKVAAGDSTETATAVPETRRGLKRGTRGRAQQSAVKQD